MLHFRTYDLQQPLHLTYSTKVTESDTFHQHNGIICIDISNFYTTQVILCVAGRVRIATSK